MNELQIANYIAESRKKLREELRENNDQIIHDAVKSNEDIDKVIKFNQDLYVEFGQMMNEEYENAARDIQQRVFTVN
ncbi:MAG: hypothetical protein CMC15_18625 [Flavobacteriaceae bacterium]|nr:hypothetical protein [Flavobacteriaceae bacterium]